MVMKVLQAMDMGMCFGVRDALVQARGVAEPTQVTMFGELVYNPLVLDDLRGRGMAMLPEAGRGVMPLSPVVLITAHGISDRERARLLAAGKTLIDTTCPLVRRVHEAARTLAAEGRLVVVLGKRGHVEVEGIVGDLRGSDEGTTPADTGRTRGYVVVENVAEVRDWGWGKIGVVCQTTTTQSEATVIMVALRAANPRAEVRYIDTICGPTQSRQQALEELLGQVDGVVVVGGKQSNNTRQLVARAWERGVPAWRVEGAGELRVIHARGCHRLCPAIDLRRFALYPEARFDVCRSPGLRHIVDRQGKTCRRWCIRCSRAWLG